ncbi:MAG: class I SAM-dependent methyltransferase [Planctomycetota bacterium]
MTGYSGRKSIGNDGIYAAGADPFADLSNERGAEDVLASLAVICPRSFDFASLDGNHEAEYLQKELTSLQPLLRDRAIVVLDDVDESWAEIKAVFNLVDQTRFSTVGTDGRVGILRFRRHSERESDRAVAGDIPA